MHPTIERFSTKFAKLPGEAVKTLNPPATESQISTFKAHLQAWNIPDLPEIFYDFYRWHDGCLYDSDCYNHEFFDEGHIFSLDGIIAEKRMWDRLEDDDTFSEYEPGCWWNKAWIPFLYRPDWWVAVIDTKGCFGGTPGQILSFDFKSAGDKFVQCASFEQWVEIKLAYLENNLLLYGKDEDGNYNTSENPAARDRIREQIIGEDCAFLVPIWKYRRQTSPENPNWSALETAIASDDLTVVRSTIESGKVGINYQNSYQMERYTPLLLAIEHRAFAVMHWLVTQGADSDQTDCYGYNAFDKVERSYQFDTANTTKIIHFVDLLLEKSDRPLHDLGSKHPLAWFARLAVLANDVEMLNFCLDRGLNVNTIAADSSNSLLHEAVQKFDCVDVAEILVNCGIDKTLKNSEGETARQMYDRIFGALMGMLGLLGDEEYQRYQKWIKILAET
jgi:cell wall assembly regulator SMI1